jgi:hypothetical protein
MKFIQWFIYLIQIINEIHAYKMTFICIKPFIYAHIHPCRWIEITLSIKFQAQNSKLRLYAHAQAIFYWIDVLRSWFKFKIIARLVDKLVSLNVKYWFTFENIGIHLVSLQKLQEISF